MPNRCAAAVRLVVAIADVSYYVRCGTRLDAESRARATSVYFPDRVLAMLPEHLSNHLCSLMPHVERLAFVCDMRVSKAGHVSRGVSTRPSSARTPGSPTIRLGIFSKTPRRRDLDPDVSASLRSLHAVYGP